METTIAEKWLREMEAELILLDDVETNPVERLRYSMPLITRFIADLKKLVMEKGFASTEAEIYFFKNIKPYFYAHQIYEILYYNLQMQKPAGTVDMIKAFYEAELLQVFREFRINAFPYAYYKTNATELDQVYFIRDAQAKDIPVLELIDPLSGFSTAMDYSFAKFIAYERLRDYLLEQLSSANSQYKNEKAISKEDSELKWTGETINLAELAYGIWLTGQINHGNVSISEIIRWLEIHLQIKIGNAHRRWQSISFRKRISPVKYLDRMRKEIIQRLDDENK
jgi:hypothetical protein